MGSNRFLVDENDSVLDAQDVTPLLRKDAKKAVEELTALPDGGRRAMKFLMRLYYMHQEYRKREARMVAALEERQEPHTLIDWAAERDAGTERAICGLLDYYTDHEPTGMGRWAKAVVGVGPVISAGLLANIDKRRRTVSQLWRFAGLDPTVPRRWTAVAEDGKRPFNQDLKTLCFKIGDCFMKFSGRDDCFYGKVYVQRKLYEIERNDAGGNAAQAAALLEGQNWRKGTPARLALEAGKLPDAQILRRAERYAVKMFLCHWLVEAHGRWFGEPMPQPLWVLGKTTSEGGVPHAHYIPAPN